MKKITALLILTFVSTFLWAQDVEGPKPISWKLKQQYNAPIAKFEGVPYRELAKEDAINDLDKSIPWRFGYEFATDLDPATAGETITLANGDQLWRIRIQTPGAYTTNLLFDWFKLKEGASVRVYSHDRTDVSKLYTHEQNNDQQILGIWPIASDDVWIEFIEPSNSIGQSKLGIGTVVHGYRNISESSDFKALNDSGNCNQDVDCDITPTGADPFSINQVKEDMKKAAAMIVLGSGVCSGALVNNTANDGTPYFLTANHCVGSNTGSWAFRFNWRSTVARCASTSGSITGSFNQTASGATLLMSSSESDSALVRITDTGFFNASPDVIWSGWNRSLTATPAINFGIHHPSGDIQKVCRDDQGAVRNTRSFNGNATTEMWLISDWDLGVTEPGSSGSPLFNENGQIIGVLSGGAAACNGTNDNNQIDYYGRFGVAWDFGNTASSRLRDWLDPNNTGVLTIDTFPASQQFNNDVAISVNSEVCGTELTSSVVINNIGLTAVTSASVLYGLGSSNNSITYAGNIAPGSSATVVLPVQVVGATPQNFTVNVTNPNGVMDEDTSNNSASNLVQSTAAYDGNNTVTFSITTDDYGDETTWSLEDLSGTILQQGPATQYASNSNFTETLNVVQGECYIFTINDSYGDGICCLEGNGSYELRTDSNVLIFSGGQFTNTEVTEFGINSTASVDDAAISVEIYPNPSKGLYNVTLQEKASYSIYDLSGKLVQEGNLNAASNLVNLSQVANGLYLINIETATGAITQKLIKE
ncbi:MAG: T9SS type A sorting domain-containing protein [Nonlabens sp.]|uniref:T9SS type A sorting domain-containing protein n=1 Tax=Nonlabens sp. TaxID=1888209 RepID=UPI003EFB1D2C